MTRLIEKLKNINEGLNYAVKLEDKTYISTSKIIKEGVAVHCYEVKMHKDECILQEMSIFEMEDMTLDSDATVSLLEVPDDLLSLVGRAFKVIRFRDINAYSMVRIYSSAVNKKWLGENIVELPDYVNMLKYIYSHMMFRRLTIAQAQERLVEDLRLLKNPESYLEGYVRALKTVSYCFERVNF